MGVAGSYSAWCANRVVSQADLVFFVGSTTGGQVTNGWTIPTRSTPVIHLDINPSDLGRNYPRTYGLWGDPKACLSHMLKELQPSPDRKWAEQAARVVRAWEEEIEPYCASDDKPIRVERLCRELSLGLPEDAVLLADTGYAGIWTGAMVYLDQPGQDIFKGRRFLGAGLIRPPWGLNAQHRTGRWYASPETAAFTTTCPRWKPRCAMGSTRLP